MNGIILFFPSLYGFWIWFCPVVLLLIGTCLYRFGLVFLFPPCFSFIRLIHEGVGVGVYSLRHALVYLCGQQFIHSFVGLVSRELKCNAHTLFSYYYTTIKSIIITTII